MVLPVSHRVSRVRWYSGFTLGWGFFSSTGFLPSVTKLSSFIRLSLPVPLLSVLNPTTYAVVWALPVSLAATGGIDYSFSSSGYLDVSVLRVCFIYLCYFSIWSLDITLVGLPHSDISGSLPACGSPKLFAAYRVLLRLLAPRHPPCALSNLTNNWSFFNVLLHFCSVWKLLFFYLRD